MTVLLLDDALPAPHSAVESAATAFHAGPRLEDTWHTCRYMYICTCSRESRFGRPATESQITAMQKYSVLVNGGIFVVFLRMLISYKAHQIQLL